MKVRAGAYVPSQWPESSWAKLQFLLAGQACDIDPQVTPLPDGRTARPCIRPRFLLNGEEGSKGPTLQEAVDTPCQGA